MKSPRPIAALAALLFTTLLAAAHEAAPPEAGAGPDAPVPGLETGSTEDAALAPESNGEKPLEPVGDEAADAEAIPKPFGIERYQASWDKNPFLLKTTPIAQPTVSWGQDWTLAGMFSYNGKIRISIRNKQTNEFKRVTNEEKPGDEFRLVRTNFSRNRKDASVVIAKGSQEAELKYDESAAPVTINNTVRAPAGGAGAGATGVVPQPGMPPQAGKPVSPTQSPRPVVQPGALSGNGVQPGMAPQPGVIGPQPAAPTTPSISRRRQLIPAPVITPSANP